MLLTQAHLNRRSFLGNSGKLLAGATLVLPGLTVQAAQSFGKAPDLKKIITQYYADYATLDLDKVLSYYREDCRFEDPTISLILRNRQEMREAFTPLVPLYRKVAFEPETLLVSGNWLISQHVQSGTMKRNQSAEFKDYRVQGVTLFEFAADKINRQFDYYDVTSMRKQLGLTGGTR